MNVSSRCAVALLALSSSFVIHVPNALAWSCQATASDGSYGYSYNYPNRRSARQRALAECNTQTYEGCYIVACQRNG